MALIPRIEKLASITTNTFQETVRQPIFALIIAVSLGLLIFAPTITAFTFDDDNVLLRDTTLSTLLVAGLFLAAFSAAGVISEEIDSRTVLTVVSKPVGRAAFVVGKYLGVAAALLLAMYIMSLGALMVLRHGVLQRNSDKIEWVVILFGGGAVLISLTLAGLLNFIYDWKFPATAVAIGSFLLTLAFVTTGFLDREWKFQSFGADLNRDVVRAFILIILAVLVLSAIAVTVSTRFNTPTTLLVCCVVFVLGLVSDHYFGRLALSGWWGTIPYTLTPNLQAFWVADALQSKEPISVEYVIRMTGYAVTYITAVLLVGVGLFQTREVG